MDISDEEPPTKIEGMTSAQSDKEKAKRYDIMRVLDKWTFGQNQMNAIEAACSRIVSSLEKDVSDLPQMRQDIKEIQNLMAEARGTNRTITLILAFVASVGALLGGIGAFK